MAEDEETLKKINSAMKRLSRGDKLKEEMALIVSPNVRWEAFLTPAPMCICLLGELMVISTRNDFPLEHTPPKDGFKLLRWPNSFGASLMQVRQQTARYHKLIHSLTRPCNFSNRFMTSNSINETNGNFILPSKIID